MYLRGLYLHICVCFCPCPLFPNQLRIGMKLQKKNWESWQMKTTHCNRITAIISVTAMQCRKKSHCLQDSYITSTKTQKALTMFLTQRQDTRKNITRQAGGRVCKSSCCKKFSSDLTFCQNLISQTLLQYCIRKSINMVWGRNWRELTWNLLGQDCYLFLLL